MHCILLSRCISHSGTFMDRKTTTIPLSMNLVHVHLEKGKDGTEKMEMFRKRPGEKNVQKNV